MSHNSMGQVRIIGGAWRGRKLLFPSLPHLRPTQDHIRETLFNWLMYDIVGAHCLDLFTGSGALSFEALSRGANSVMCIDADPAIAKALQDNMCKLNAKNMAIMNVSYAKAKLPQDYFDIVFIDPPFDEALHVPVANWLEAQTCLAKTAYIYIEAKKNSSIAGLPAHWTCLKHRATATVDFYLFCRQGE